MCIRDSYVAVKNGFQAALMAPTEILVNQHFANFCSFFAGTGIRVEKITGSMTAKQKADVRERLAAGEIDFLVGTHALIQKDVVFSNLALVCLLYTSWITIPKGFYF